MYQTIRYSPTRDSTVDGMGGMNYAVRNVPVTSVAPTRDLSTVDFSLLKVLHSEPTSTTLQGMTHNISFATSWGTAASNDAS